MNNITINSPDIKANIFSGIIVFLVAIPLCLGIALASGAPLFSGILAGVIGGIIVGTISASPFSVSGPAAGMVAVVFTAIQQLGGFEAFLLALFFSGIIQLLMGIFRAGFIADYVPNTVIQGLLAAIGILIIIKQLPLAFGLFTDPKSLQTALILAQETFSLKPILALAKNINLSATLITLISLLILIQWEKTFPKAAKIFPAAILVVIIAVMINFIYLAAAPQFYLQDSHLVNIPINSNFSEFFSQFIHPDFSQWQNPNIYIYAVMIAVIGTIETLLTIQAVERLDKKHRYTNRNRELIAQGVGNTLAGLFGGISITSVIVRSSANIYAGATNKLSTIFHGLLLLLSLTFLARYLNYIPLAALASILIYTGGKLARVSLFKEVYEEGPRYFIPFIVTIIAIVFTNLLIGILIGLFISIFFILLQNSKNGFTLVNEIRPSGETLRLILPQQVTFINKASIVANLNKIPKASRVIIDATNTDYIDNDIFSIIKQFKEFQAPQKNILLNLEGFQDTFYVLNHRNFINATTYDVQSTLTPQIILNILREGNKRFTSDISIHQSHRHNIQATSRTQHPIAVILGCIDSRVPVEMIFDVSVGDIFVVRIAGNITNTDILGSLEFACKVAGAKLIVVLGHKNCGAIKAACDDVHLGHLTQLLDKIKPAIESETKIQTERTGENEQFVLNVTENNIALTQRLIYQHSSIVKELIDSQQIDIVGAIYDVNTGEVAFKERL